MRIDSIMTLEIQLHFANGSVLPIEIDTQSIWELRRLIAEDNRLMEERVLLLRTDTVLYDDDVLLPHDRIQIQFLRPFTAKRPRMMEH